MPTWPEDWLTEVEKRRRDPMIVVPPALSELDVRTFETMAPDANVTLIVDGPGLAHFERRVPIAVTNLADDAEGTADLTAAMASVGGGATPPTYHPDLQRLMDKVREQHAAPPVGRDKADAVDADIDRVLKMLPAAIASNAYGLRTALLDALADRRSLVENLEVEVCPVPMCGKKTVGTVTVEELQQHLPVRPVLNPMFISNIVTQFLGCHPSGTGAAVGKSRQELIALWLKLGFTVGAEVGVEQGEFAEAILKGLPKAQLFCVDAWRAYPQYREHVTQEKLDAFLASTTERLAFAGDRVHIIRDWSTGAASQFKDGALDFVYIDANHTLPQVVADLTAWTPKVRQGGLIAGHDYGRGSVGHVREAVVAWTQSYKLNWWLLTGDRSPSFLWVKP